jgi:hypothetical protein
VNGEETAIATMGPVERVQQWEGVAHITALGGECPRSSEVADGSKGFGATTLPPQYSTPLASLEAPCEPVLCG